MSLYIIYITYYINILFIDTHLPYLLFYEKMENHERNQTFILHKYILRDIRNLFGNFNFEVILPNKKLHYDPN